MTIVTTTTQHRSLRDFGADLAFEWTKLSGVRSTWLNLLTALIVTVGLDLLIGTSVKASGDNGFDVAKPAPHLAFQMIIAAQFLIMLVATLLMSSEYSHGSIKTTLQSVPARWEMLLAKTSVVAALGVAVGALLAVAGTLTISVFAGDYGAYTAREFALSTAATAVTCAMLAWIALGIAAVVRSSTAAIVVIIVLFGIPQMLPIFGVEWLVKAADYFPTGAATVLGLQSTEPYGAGVAIALLAGWSALSLGAGYGVLRHRDA